MATKYIVNHNAQPTGEHEVHAESHCSHLPDVENRILLGYYSNCTHPIRDARLKWPDRVIDGCKHCIPQCHKK